MRLFIGIPIPATLTAELSGIAGRLQGKEDRLRWSPAESFHITLQFLGISGAEQYECLLAKLREVRSGPVPIRPAALGFFERAGVFFAGIDLTAELAALQRRVSEANGQCGFVSESRPYHPHITLARSRSKGNGRIHDMHALSEKVQRVVKLTAFRGEEFVLYESVPAPGGSLYQVRERFPLDLGPRPAAL